VVEKEAERKPSAPIKGVSGPPWNMLENKLRNKTPILVYHKTGIKFDWSGTWNTASQFNLHMKYLHAMGYKTCALKEAIAGHQSKRLAITFDDAYESVYTLAYPIMKKFGFRGTVFVITGYVGRKNSWDVNLGFRRWGHMSWDQIREMANDGFEFGSHTESHSDLTRLAPDVARRELSSSKAALEANLDRPCRYLSYPFGRTNPAVKHLVEAAGYEAAFTIAADKYRDVMEVGRMGVYVTDLLFDLKAKLGLFGSIIGNAERGKGRFINFFSNGTTIVNRLRRSKGWKMS